MVDRKQITERLERMVQEISTRNTYSGGKISSSIIEMLKLEEREDGVGVLAPFWLSVTERGRGPRKSSTDSGLAQKLYRWMAKRNMFKSRTEKGKINEAKGLAWYINKYGNKQFREKAFTDIYTSARESAIKDITEEYGKMAIQITKDIL